MQYQYTASMCKWLLYTAFEMLMNIRITYLLLHLHNNFMMRYTNLKLTDVNWSHLQCEFFFSEIYLQMSLGFIMRNQQYPLRKFSMQYTSKKVIYYVYNISDSSSSSDSDEVITSSLERFYFQHTVKLWLTVRVGTGTMTVNRIDG
jgi:hypothetical protein